MSKAEENKKAWEQAYDHKNYDTSTVREELRTKRDAFLHPVLRDTLREEDIEGKSIVHFFCNNGRELLSICKSMQAVGTGYDIADHSRFPGLDQGSRRDI